MLLNTFKRMIGLKRLFQAFSSQNLFLKHTTQILVRHERRMYLNKTLLPKQKLVLDAVKRPLDSTIVGLKDQGKCAAVIKGRSGFPELDIVLDGVFFKKLNKNSVKKNRLINIRIDGEEILCNIDKIEEFQNRFVSKVYLNRFIEGQPNEIELFVEPTGFAKNPHLLAGQPPEQQTSIKIKIITYNSDYPPILTYPVNHVSPLRSYKFADLANTLPPGIFLHPTVDLNKKLFSIKMPQEKDEDQDDMQKIEKMKQLDKLQAKAKKDQKKASTPAGGQQKKQGGK